MHKLILSGRAYSRRSVTMVSLVICIIGVGELASAAKPDKPRGQTENAPASATILAGDGLVSDGFNDYFDYRVAGSLDCLLFTVPSRDGADGGRATLFHTLPDDGECIDPPKVRRSFGVSSTKWSLSDPNPVQQPPKASPGPEPGLAGQFRCFDVFTADTSTAWCWFRILGAPDGSISWRIDWPSVTVAVDPSNPDARTVTNNGDATIYQAVQTVNGKSGKLATELVNQGPEPIALAIKFERLSY